MILRLICWLIDDIKNKGKYMSSDDVACEEAKESADYWSYDDCFERIKFKRDKEKIGDDKE